MKCLLVIPAYNEQENIERVVDELVEHHSGYDYVIVNDGSRDDTARICRERGYRFIDLPVNLGLAGAFQAGLKYAHINGYDIVIQFDADGQHLPMYLDDLVAALEDNDIVIGSRYGSDSQPKGLRGFGSALISGMIRLTTAAVIHDPTSGMRAYNRRMIEELASGPNLGPEPDTISYLVKKRGARVVEVPVAMAERLAGESYLNLRRSASYMMRAALSILLIQFFR